MSRKRIYEDPYIPPLMGPGPLQTPGSYYDDTTMFSEASLPKRPTHAYPQQFGMEGYQAVGDSWDKERYAALNAGPNSVNMEFERYEPNKPPRDMIVNKRRIIMELPMPTLPKYEMDSKFGLGLDKYGHEQPGMLMNELHDLVGDMKSELAFLQRHPEVANRIPNALKLLEKETFKVENSVEPDWLEVDINKPINLVKKIIIPSSRNPSFNFVGKIIGPKGQTLQNLAKTFKSQIMLLGEGSSRDAKKEVQLFNSGNPRYIHYGIPLFVQVSTIARPHVAFQRMAGLLNCLHKLLLPSHDIHITGITDHNVWFESGEAVVYDPIIFDETADEDKEYDLRAKCAAVATLNSLRGRGRGPRYRRGAINSSNPGADEDPYVMCYDPDASESSSKVRSGRESANDGSQNGNEFRMSPSDKPNRGRGRGRGRGAVPIRRN